MSNNGVYEVGYGKPPRKHQFQKGQSGSPRGRPKGSTRIFTRLSGVLRQTALVLENGKPKRISKIVTAATRILDKAASAGDIPSFQAMMKLVPLLGLKPEAPDDRFTLIIED